MKNIAFTVFVSLFSILLSCASKNEMQNVDADSKAESPGSPMPEAPSTDLYSNGLTKLIKTAHFRFQVENVKRSAEEIETAIRKYPAYISASDMKLENPILENKMTIRVQNEFFQDLLKDIDKQASYVNFRDVKTEDVAKQFVDLESRLKTKRQVEERYMEILRKKAGTIEELLDAERQIGALHEEIEATVSRINHLRNEVQYSTIQLEFYQTINPDLANNDKVSTGQKLGEGLTAGWQGVVAIVVGLVYLWPLLLIATVVTWVYYFRRRNKLQSALVKNDHQL